MLYRPINSNRMNIKSKYLYIDCTITANSRVNSGIQRVVKNVVPKIMARCENYDYIAKIVIFHMGRYYLVNEENMWEFSVGDEFLDDDRSILLNDRIKIIKNLIPDQIRKTKIYRKAAVKFKRTMLSWFRNRNQHPNKHHLNMASKNELGQASTLLLLDSNWNNSIWHQVDLFRAGGGNVSAVCYDLIPFSHPDTVEEVTRVAHTTWWREAPSHLDSVICISKSVKEDYEAWQTAEGINKPVLPENVHYFYLGAEFSSADPVIRLLTENEDFFLMVGSIEPRKNHGTVIDAFEFLWGMGIRARLAIVGAFGWKSEELLDRISDHPQFNKQLFLIRDASDRDLVALYSKATALVIASLAEGFGLPIIEARARGASVVCSNLPVFKEIAGSEANYFIPNSAADLASKLKPLILKSSAVTPVVSASECIRTTWESSAEQLLQVL